jgi:hypothetical protein
MHLRVPRLLLVLCRRRGRNQRRIDDGSLPQKQAALLKVRVDGAEEKAPKKKGSSLAFYLCGVEICFS